jgi:hypothetical protein
MSTSIELTLDIPLPYTGAKSKIEEKEPRRVIVIGPDGEEESEEGEDVGLQHVVIVLV